MDDLSAFEIGSMVHVVTLLACAVIVIVTVILTRRHCHDARITRGIRASIVFGCLSSWVLSNGFWLQPSYFDWSSSLPLHFCNLANLVSAVAIWKKTRPAQSLLYFWSFGLCTWAMLTPALTAGPMTLWFWLFWLYHLFIFISVAVVLTDGFRPTWADFRRSLTLTLSYMGILAIVDAVTGWNYGFVGKGMPLQPSPMDFLGPYPIRLLWIALIGTTIFALLMLPWIRRNPNSQSR